MDDQTRVPELDDGRVRMTGGTLPGSFPHICPYRPQGADQDFCAETTSNLQRNKNGCCGTSDSRGFAPCNSRLRKCIACLLAGDGIKNKPVVDTKRGLCADHVQAADNPLPPRPFYKPQPIVRRVAVDIGPVTRRPRPTFARAPAEQEKLRPPAFIERLVKPYEPQPPAPVVKKVEEEPEVVVGESGEPDVPSPEKTVEPPVEEVLPHDGEDSPPELLVPELVPAQLLEPAQVEEMARMVPDFSPRELETCLLLVDKEVGAVARELGIRESGVINYMHMACRWWELPKDKPLEPFDRLAALRTIMRRYKELEAEGCFTKPAPPAPIEDASSLDLHELKALEIFRSMGADKRVIALRVLKAIKSE